MNADKGWLLALDPGVNAGVAAFLDGRLVGAAVISAPKDRDKHRPDIDAHHEHARLISGWFAGVRLGCLSSCSFACEWPKLYQRDRAGQKDYNDYLGLTALDLALRARLTVCTSCVVYPAEWKGQLSGDDDSLVRERVRARLVGPELAAGDELRGGKAHNGWDAVGIGLHVLGRGLVNDRIRKYPR